MESSFSVSYSSSSLGSLYIEDESPTSSFTDSIELIEHSHSHKTPSDHKIHFSKLPSTMNKVKSSSLIKNLPQTKTPTKQELPVIKSKTSLPNIEQTKSISSPAKQQAPKQVCGSAPEMISIPTEDIKYTTTTPEELSTQVEALANYVAMDSFRYGEQNEEYKSKTEHDKKADAKLYKAYIKKHNEHKILLSFHQLVQHYKSMEEEKPKNVRQLAIDIVKKHYIKNQK